MRGEDRGIGWRSYLPQHFLNLFPEPQGQGSFRQNEPEATEQLYQEIAPTFVEDRVMVETQQARFSEFGGTASSNRIGCDAHANAA
jgi:hypothetical protein